MKRFSPSERLILLYLRIAHAEQHQGVTRREIVEATGMGERSFERAWKRLLAENLVIVDHRLTEMGLAEAKADMPVQVQE